MRKKLFAAWAVRCADGKTHSRITPTRALAKKLMTFLDDNAGRCSQEAVVCGPHRLVKLLEVTK